MVGAESLVGLTEGDMFNQTHNLRLFMFPIHPLKWILLAFRFLLHGIILKPKLSMGRLFLKLRFKEGLFHKRTEFVTISLLHAKDEHLCAFVGGRDICFKRTELDVSLLTSVEYEGVQVPVPRDHQTFVRTYNKDLLGGFYQSYNVSFDSNSEKKAVQFMHNNVAVMNQAGIDFWIEGGTLLGALRDQKLIPWDHDLDFGMRFNSKEQMKTLIKLLRRHFYVSVRDFPKTDKIWNLGDYRVLKIYPRKLLFFKEELCLDLFVYYEGTIPEQDEPVYKYVVWNRNAYHLKEFLDKTETITFYGKQVPVPSNPEKFIEAKYGKDWRTPKKEWNVALDDGSIYRAG